MYVQFFMLQYFAQNQLSVYVFFFFAAVMKLSKSSKAVIFLQKNLWIGVLFFANKTKILWASNLKFMAHKLNNFQTKFNNIDADMVARTISLLFVIFEFWKKLTSLFRNNSHASVVKEVIASFTADEDKSSK